MGKTSTSKSSEIKKTVLFVLFLYALCILVYWARLESFSRTDHERWQAVKGAMGFSPQERA